MSSVLILHFAFLILNFYGCASAPSAVSPAPLEAIPGFYHRVEKGQTLWRISKIYQVDLEELVRVNRIADSTSIEVGQMVLIPKEKKQVLVYSAPTGEDFLWPLKGRVIGYFNQTYAGMINKGLNIQPYSDNTVLASRSGRVVFYSPHFKGFGRTLIIDHGDGFMTVYSRNAQEFVKIGQNVSRGQAIARAGSAGKDKNTYLHFEIRKGHLPQNPSFYLP